MKIINKILRVIFFPFYWMYEIKEELKKIRLYGYYISYFLANTSDLGLSGFQKNRSCKLLRAIGEGKYEEERKQLEPIIYRLIDFYFLLIDNLQE